MTASNIDPAVVDRLLRRAGHPRRDQSAGLRISVGYVVGWADDGGVAVSWDGGLDTDWERDSAALFPLADTLTAAGYLVEYTVQSQVVGDEEVRWPALLVKAAITNRERKGQHG